MTGTFSKDIIIIGGGIAGLWTLNRLLAEGYDAVLLESRQLGQGQTLASQGMIHGGVKYTLGGKLTGASENIADMPALWKACMEGQGDIDLRGTRLLSSRYFMWPKQSMRSKLTAFLGSKALRGKVDAISEDDYPAFFSGRINGPLYQLTDIVLDVPSLLHSLSSHCRERIFSIDGDALQAALDAQGNIDHLIVPQQDQQFIRLSASRYVLTAGEGTEGLLSHLALPQVPMQRRPLQMVMVRHRNPHPVYVHCVSDKLSATPALTVTSHPAPGGDQVWYLGGELAESGVGLAAEQQIARAAALLDELFPWCDFHDCSWDTLNVNRAEPRQADGRRPDSPFIHTAGNIMVCWPTKLTLAPALGNQVLATLEQQRQTPAKNCSPHPPLPFPGIGNTPWNHL